MVSSAARWVQACRWARRALLLATLGGALAAPSVASDEVMAAERVRIAALVADDFPALERLIAPDSLYGHSSGLLETKTEFLAALRAGRLKYKSIEHADVVVRVHGATAILQGTSKVRAVSGGVDATVNLRFLLIYVRERHGWQFSAWQSTRLP